MHRPEPAHNEASDMGGFPLPAVAAGQEPLVWAFTGADVADLRHAVRAYAGRAGLAGDPLDDFVVAVHELMTNAVLHGGGHGRLHLRCEGDSLLCDVTDNGPGFAAGIPSAASPPPPNTPGGRGLMLARMLTDTLLISDSPGGVTVSVTVCLPAATQAIVAPMEIPGSTAVPVAAEQRQGAPEPEGA